MKRKDYNRNKQKKVEVYRRLVICWNDWPTGLSEEQTNIMDMMCWKCYGYKRP
jgi:hypothetical protein